jgi:hypothetical protein
MEFFLILLVIIGAIGVASYLAQARHYRVAANERAIRESLGLPVSNNAAVPSSSCSYGVTDTSSGFDCGADGGCD